VGAGARSALVVQEVSSVSRRMPAARMHDGMGGVMAERAPLVRAGRREYPAPLKSVCVAVTCAGVGCVVPRVWVCADARAGVWVIVYADAL
jgi:hypothetical protein